MGSSGKSFRSKVPSAAALLPESFVALITPRHLWVEKYDVRGERERAGRSEDAASKGHAPAECNLGRKSNGIDRGGRSNDVPHIALHILSYFLHVWIREKSAIELALI